MLEKVFKPKGTQRSDFLKRHKAYSVPERLNLTFSLVPLMFVEYHVVYQNMARGYESKRIGKWC